MSTDAALSTTSRELVLAQRFHHLSGQVQEGIQQFSDQVASPQALQRVTRQTEFLDAFAKQLERAPQGRSLSGGRVSLSCLWEAIKKIGSLIANALSRLFSCCQENETNISS